MALVGLAPTATIPQRQGVLSECWRLLERTGGTWVGLSAGMSPW